MNEATLLKIITDHVPKTANVKIVSDGWASYNKLKNLGYDHCVVVHKETFVNEDGHHTNSIESIWSQVKCWFSFMHGVRDKHFDHGFLYYTRTDFMPFATLKIRPLIILMCYK